MDRQRLIYQIIEHEGMELKPYTCTAGRLTIGAGRNLDDKGITRQEAMTLLENDIDECLADLNNNIFPDFFLYPETVQLVLADMRFNLGPKRFRSFKKMITAVKKQDWPKMAQEMEDSKWCGDVKGRCVNLVKMVDSLENLHLR
jgi:lysozyme